MLIKRLSQGTNEQSQPLVFLFHNAAAEKNYFQLMNIDVLEKIENGGAGARIPMNLLQPTPAQLRSGAWAGNIVLDTQRLWKAFLVGTGEEKDAPLALGKICKAIGVTTKYLHNAGKLSLSSWAL